MSKQKQALKLLEEIKENIGICCAITMEPDEVLLYCDKLEEIIKQLK